MARGTSRKSKTPQKKEREAQNENDDTASVEANETSDAVVMSPREQRRRHREALRAKATGKIEIPVDTAATTPSKHIVFGDDEDVASLEEKEKDVMEEPVDQNEEIEKEQEKNNKGQSRNESDEKDDDDDDDAVEEVQTSRAREAEKAKRSRERDSARTILQTQSKKRKRKKATAKEDKKEKNHEENENEFDERFFQQLEEEKQAEKEERKRAKKLERQSKGRHTSFVVADEEESGALPTAAGGIKVAIIPQNIQPTIGDPSEVANIYSKDRLENGSDGLSAKQIQRAKKLRRAPEGNPSWQRSTKMNRLLAPRQSRRAGGRPAPFFAKKK